MYRRIQTCSPRRLHTAGSHCHRLTLGQTRPEPLLPSAAWRVQGLGLVPQMGYSTWNDCGSTPNETWVKRTARYLIDSGLAAKGFNHVNVDEGWCGCCCETKRKEEGK